MIKKLLCLFAVLSLCMSMLSAAFAANAAYNSPASDIPIAESLNEAAVYYREAFTRMEPSCKVAFACKEPINDDAVLALWELIWEETGDPAQGDYLRYSIADLGDSRSTAFINGSLMPVLELRMSRFCAMDDPELAKQREAEVALKAHKIAEKYIGKTTFEIIKGVHDEICTTIGYDNEGALTNHLETRDGTPWSAWKGISQNTCVCNGYATLYYYILHLLGVNVRCVSDDSHIWNIVELDGLWYIVDNTWDEVVSDSESTSSGGLKTAGTDYLLKGAYTHAQSGHIPDEYCETEEYMLQLPLSAEDYDLANPSKSMPGLPSPELVDADL